ncbi:phage tail protein [Flavilitoribacter nigricans]|uniref:Phage tail protein n=1 Tax=Flavilitoribacter nigricans (strain ATCC 23147 / DSM 23189 / NBRC 102662 / NCIMB 1420 / SS-2) TaxID=1122177 RepID=A0A2D0N181_FLAN2|nr:phage tail protein [Flavilitoribacter nigricans]PHN02217.1 phage tail protein [Flavilitoribacter nigricans DSM 23189 = NBRC 102662]
MADPTGKKENAIWPMPKFYFKVSWGSATISFSEVSGLDTEAQIIEYRHGDSPVHLPIKMPGIQKVSNVTMKRGVFVGDNKFFDWFSQIKLNTITKGREKVTIQLLNETGKPTMIWELNNAWPTKITSTDMKSDGNEAAIDTIEIAYETLIIKNKNNP